MTITDAVIIKPKQWVAGVIMCIGTLAPGVLAVYHFRPDLFIALETAKLAIFAGALTLPLILLNAIAVLPRELMHGNHDMHAKDLVDPADLYLSACMASGMTLYPSIAAAHFMKLSFGHFCIIIVGSSGLSVGSPHLLWYLALQRAGG